MNEKLKQEIIEALESLSTYIQSDYTYARAYRAGFEKAIKDSVSIVEAVFLTQGMDGIEGIAARAVAKADELKARADTIAAKANELDQQTREAMMEGRVNDALQFQEEKYRERKRHRTEG